MSVKKVVNLRVAIKHAIDASHNADEIESEVLDEVHALLEEAEAKVLYLLVGKGRDCDCCRVGNGKD